MCILVHNSRERYRLCVLITSKGERENISGNTRSFQIRLKHKALIYAFGKRHRNIVRVDLGQECYYVVCEEKGKAGKYYIVEYPYNDLDGVDKDIQEALHALSWIAGGNEFPEK